MSISSAVQAHTSGQLYTHAELVELPQVEAMCEERHCFRILVPNKCGIDMRCITKEPTTRKSHLTDRTFVHTLLEAKVAF